MENIKSSHGISEEASSAHISIQRVGVDQTAVVQSIFERSPTYFEKVDGSKVQSHFAKREMSDTPKNRISSYEKWFCLIELNHKPVGVIDLHKDHPAQGIVYVGLLLLIEEIHGKGIGRKVFQEAEKFAVVNLGATSLRLGVSEKNDVEDYWKKMGFIRNGHSYTWKGENHSSTVFEMDKSLTQS